MTNPHRTRIPAEPTWYVDSSPEPEDVTSSVFSVAADAPPSTLQASTKSLPSPPPSQAFHANTSSPTGAASCSSAADTDADADAPLTACALRVNRRSTLPRRHHPEPSPPSPATRKLLDFEASDNAAFLRVLNMAPDPYAMNAEEREEMRLEGETWAECERLGLNRVDKDHPERGELVEMEWEEWGGTPDGGGEIFRYSGEEVQRDATRFVDECAAESEEAGGKVVACVVDDGVVTPPPAMDHGSPIRPGLEDFSPITTPGAKSEPVAAAPLVPHSARLTSPVPPDLEDVSPVTTASPGSAASSCVRYPAENASKRRRIV